MATSTYNTGDTRTPPAIHADLERIETALGEYACTSGNPCGGCAYYEESEALPWRVHFADGASDESFATAEEAVAAAEAYADEMNA